jgi:hypothetical protein
MYRYEPSISGKDGFVRIGGRPGSGDPFIDLKMFCTFQPGTPSAVFGASFDNDVCHRDFACNAVYYDPVNGVLVDPTGQGVADATGKILNIVSDPKVRSAYHQATVAIRFFKFLCRGFTCSEETKTYFVETFCPCLPAMKKISRVNYMRTQLLSKQPTAVHKDLLNRFHEHMCAFGLNGYWDDLFEPILSDLLSDSEKGE